MSDGGEESDDELLRIKALQQEYNVICLSEWAFTNHCERIEMIAKSCLVTIKGSTIQLYKLVFT